PIGRDQTANVLFTSGSTGKPKGVMLRHRSLSNLYSQMKVLLDPIPGTVLCSTNSVFDCFVVETLIALALGRTVVLADDEEMMLPWKLAALMEKYQTGIFEMTPSRLQMCLGNDAFCQAAHNIKIVLLGGEVVTRNLSEKFYKHSDGVIMNMYGPTEATVFTTMGPVRLGEDITVGKPLQNTRTYVLDEQMRPVIPTACGEMYIAGECLSAGYISRPELTESSFVEDIYFSGEKMYKSGDIVRLRIDGEYDYVGRKDAQVKLNGQRVDLGEITGAIMDTGCVAQAAVIPLKKDDGSMELYAFYEGNGQEVSQESIREHIGKVLPKYMIPAHFIEMEHIPMTATNKIDQQALKSYASNPVQEVAECPAKVDVSESYVLSVWNRVLSVPATETDRSFFDLGGTSIGALNVLSHYFNDRLEMTLAEFYENPTAEGQMALLKKQMNTEVQEVSAELEIKEKQPKIEWSLPVQPSKKVKTVKKKNDKAILVTGATGFFGAHLVQQLLSKGCQVVCLLRDGNAERLYQC
ncbi:MAG: AMP-binding protein, partial [Lachnospiraceae bacterium]|nr:AMP-binding protein [Lachnospiraceae bacterium]